MNFLEACERIKNEKNKKEKFIQSYEVLVANNKQSLNKNDEFILKQKLIEAKRRERSKRFMEMMNNPKGELFDACINELKNYKYYDMVKYKIFKALMEGAFDKITKEMPPENDI